jgi:hypothetical protein
MTKEYLYKKFDEETDLIATHDTEDYIEWLELKVLKNKEISISIIKNIINYNSVQSWGKALRYAVKELEEKLTSDNKDCAVTPSASPKSADADLAQS